MAWTDESKQEAIDMYSSADATPETSMEIVKDIAEELNESPNGIDLYGYRLKLLILQSMLHLRMDVEIVHSRRDSVYDELDLMEKRWTQ